MSKSGPIRIGTRESELALWQANKVKTELETLGYEAVLVPVKSAGDIELEKPLYEMGITGIFTKSLDVALLKNDVDIAVHSMKDVPTLLPDGIVQTVVLERHISYDVLVYKDAQNVLTKYDGVIATGSLRRKAQWLSRHEKHTVVNLRGNVNTRLQKLEDSEWNGAIFAGAGLDRLGKLPQNHRVLDWMIPAPAQGAIMICAREDDQDCRAACAQLNHEDSEICTRIERDFLRTLEGGCTAPIGALAVISKNGLGAKHIEFKGILLSIDGQKKREVSKIVKLEEAGSLGRDCAQTIISEGGREIILADAKKRDDMAKNLAKRAKAPVSKTVKTRAKKGAKKKVKSPLIEIKKKTSKPAVPDDSPVTIVSTRKLTDAQLMMTGKTVQIEGLDFIKTEFLPIPPEAVRTDSMIITSQATVRALLTSFPRLNLRFKNIYCVGNKTKTLVEERLGRVLYTAPSARELAAYLSKNMAGRAITYFCSTARRDELPDILARHHIKVTEIPSYATRYTGRKIDSDFAGVLFYSPSGVRSYVQNNSADKTAFCIGETTAHEARTYFKNVMTAAQPTIEHVLYMVNKYYA